MVQTNAYMDTFSKTIKEKNDDTKQKKKVLVEIFGCLFFYLREEGTYYKLSTINKLHKYFSFLRGFGTHHL